MIQAPGTISCVTATGSPLCQSCMVLSFSAKAVWSSFPSLPKPRGPLYSLCQSCVIPSLVWLGFNPSPSLPLQPHFQLLLQSVTPASIPVFFQLYWAAVVSLGRCGPMAWSQSSPSSHTGSVTRGVASQLHLGWKSLPSPFLKAGPQLFNISMKPVKGYRYVK